MSEHGNRGGRGPGRGNGAGNGSKPAYSSNRSSSGERRYSKPAGVAPSGERRYAKPAGAAPSGERRYAKPAGAAPSGERRYAKPAGAAPSGERHYAKPAGAAPSGERRYAKPAGAAPSGERRYAKPAGAAPSGERRYSRPAGAAPSGERRYSKPAGAAPSGERRYAKPAGAAPSGERHYSRPAGAAPSGERHYAKPAGAAPSGERHYSKPAGATPSGEHRYAKPAGAAPSGERRYSRPAGAAPSGERHYSKPAGGSRPYSSRPRSTFNSRPAAPVEHTDLTPGARRVALQVLSDVHKEGAYAALALQNRLTAAKLSPADRRLATSIVYSTLEQQLQIDFALDRLMEHPTTDLVQRDILRLSACQILFHDRVPDSAAVNEAGNIARLMAMEGTVGFLNGVLRNLVRGKEEIPWPKKEEDLREYLHIMGSTPLWLVDKLIAVYGEETAEKIVMYRPEEHDMVARPNLMKLTDEAFESLLAGKAWRWKPGVAPHAYLLGGVTELALDNDYRAGNFSVQGQSSILAAEAMQVAPGMRVLDVCAAPGGKACYMAETMQGTGRVYAWELHEKRAMLLESAKRRLKLDNLRISVRDATEPKPDFEGAMDGVLLDAPCTGLGVLAEKPDLKYRLKEEDITAIAAVQKKLLDTVCAYVKPGGTLVYSTCSILPEENSEQIKTFLKDHPSFSLQPLPLTYPEAFRGAQTPFGLQLLAHRDGVEGFFIARMRRAKA